MPTTYQAPPPLCPHHSHTHTRAKTAMPHLCQHIYHSNNPNPTPALPHLCQPLCTQPPTHHPPITPQHTTPQPGPTNPPLLCSNLIPTPDTTPTTTQNLCTPPSPYTITATALPSYASPSPSDQPLPLSPAQILQLLSKLRPTHRSCRRLNSKPHFSPKLHPLPQLLPLPQLSHHAPSTLCQPRIHHRP